MTASSRAPGRLPARVYWFRRALVLGTALALVVAVARLLGGTGGDDPSARAAITAANPTPSTGAGAMGPVPLVAGATPTGTAPPVVLAQPDGPCAVNEITVTPVLGTPTAGGSVPLTLGLTGIRPACTFTVSAASLVAKVTHGAKRVWSSQDCPRSVPKTTVVVRSAAPTIVQVNWSGRRSDRQCSRASDWAMPGTYQVIAAVIGSEPTQAQFSLKTPPRPVVTRTVHPKPKKKAITTTQTANAGG